LFLSGCSKQVAEDPAVPAAATQSGPDLQQRAYRASQINLPSHKIHHSSKAGRRSLSNIIEKRRSQIHTF
jgi:hypothetical protein